MFDGFFCRFLYFHRNYIIMKEILLFAALLFALADIAPAQTFSGTVSDNEGNALENVKVYLVEDDLYDYTDADGKWSITSPDLNNKTLVFNKEGYVYDQLLKQAPSTGITFILREAVLSAASLREIDYVQHSCANISIPDDPKWNVIFKETTLKGDLAPDSKYTRRDPSAVIEVDGKYYVWYSYSLTFDDTKIAPWDRNDLYYATSTDGITWDEQGIAVGRGEDGSFDARSVFTTEIFVHDGRYYLVYQAAANKDGIYNRNVVGMSVSHSPDGPWTKLEEPVLFPSYTRDLYFDNNAVHDPCLVLYKNRFHLYYKGECNCMGADGCKRWCNPVCGIRKQVKWGVAVADSPTGPYRKSAYNPVTNTGHEVMVWPYADGIAILQHQDGPEANTIQYAGDGYNFSIKGKVTGIPEAAGLFRSEKSDNDPHAGISWGLAHVLKWDAGPKGWMYIQRFDLVKKEAD